MTVTSTVAPVKAIAAVAVEVPAIPPPAAAGEALPFDSMTQTAAAMRAVVPGAGLPYPVWLTTNSWETPWRPV